MVLVEPTTRGYANAYRTAAIRATTICRAEMHAEQRQCGTWRARNTLRNEAACRDEESENTPEEAV